MTALIKKPDAAGDGSHDIQPETFALLTSAVSRKALAGCRVESAGPAC